MSSKKSSKITIAVPQCPNPRAHILLFKNNTPFKPKSVPSKLLHQRNKKHRKNPINFD